MSKLSIDVVCYPEKVASQSLQGYGIYLVGCCTVFSLLVFHMVRNINERRGRDSTISVLIYMKLVLVKPPTMILTFKIIHSEMKNRRML